MTSAFRRLLVPATTTFVGFIVLLSLGTWQVYRLNWKERILARIEVAEAGPAQPLPPNPEPYTKVFAIGRFRFDRAAEFGSDVHDTTRGTEIGSYQIVPLERDQKPTILVNRGWVPQKQDTAIEDPTGVVTVSGYIRPGESAHWFSAPDDPPARQFYTLDPHAIAAAVGISDVAPFTLVALGSDKPDVYPAPAEHLPRPPNNHLSYAITWYSLATSLVVIFGLWVRKALRL